MVVVEVLQGDRDGGGLMMVIVGDDKDDECIELCDADGASGDDGL